MLTRLLLLILISFFPGELLSQQTFTSTRNTQFEWQCETESGDRLSGHTRQDKAVEACANRALASPGTTYIVRSGSYRIVATGGALPPEPPTDPPEPPDPDPIPPDPTEPEPLVTLGPVSALTEYPSMASMQRDEFSWRIRVTFNNIDTRMGIVSRDESGQADPGHLSMWMDSGRIEVRNQDIANGSPVVRLASSSLVTPGREYGVVVSLSQTDGLSLWIDGTLEDVSPTGYGLANNELPMVLCGNRSRVDGSTGPDEPLDGTCYMEIWPEPTELPQPNSATLRWTSPTEYAECDPDDPAENCGQPIGPGDLTAFNVYMTQPDSQLIREVEGDVNSYEFVTTRNGLHCFEVTAIAGTESDRSNEACKQLQ